MFKIIIGFLWVLISFNAQAADLAVPNTFMSGTPAIAAEINSNFAAIQAAVNANAANIRENQAAGSLTVYANNQKIGKLASTDSFPFFNKLNLISDKNYLFTMTGQGDIGTTERQLYYEHPTCMGNTYISTSIINAATGIVFKGKALTSLYYIPHAQTSINAASTSMLLYGLLGVDCYPADVVARATYDALPHDVYQVFLNEPSVTGVMNSYTLPISLGQ